MTRNTENIGCLVRHWRKKLGLSIRGLAGEAGLSPAIICRIESEVTSPSFATLKKMLEVFGVNFAEFFAVSRLPDDSPVIMAKDMKQVCGIGRGLKVLLVNAGKSKDIQFFREEYAAGGNTGRERLQHESVEAGLCIEGELILELAGRNYRIVKGDGWFFDSRLPHRFLNPGKKKAVLISANTPAAF